MRKKNEVEIVECRYGYEEQVDFAFCKDILYKICIILLCLHTLNNYRDKWKWMGNYKVDEANRCCVK